MLGVSLFDQDISGKKCEEELLYTQVITNEIIDVDDGGRNQFTSFHPDPDLETKLVMCRWGSSATSVP